jgi:hypothetical protein
LREVSRLSHLGGISNIVAKLSGKNNSVRDLSGNPGRREGQSHQRSYEFAGHLSRMYGIPDSKQKSPPVSTVWL